MEIAARRTTRSARRRGSIPAASRLHAWCTPDPRSWREPRARAPAGQALEALHHLAHVLDLGRTGEGVRHELPPFLPVCAAVEILGVVLHGVPGQEKPVARGLLDRTLQRHRPAALGALEQWRGLGGAGFEFGLLAGLNVDLCDFEKHGA